MEDAVLAAQGLGGVLHELRVIAVVITAVSLFLLLVGIGQLLIGGTGTSPSVSWAIAAAGATLVPFWWREATREDPVAVRG